MPRLVEANGDSTIKASKGILPPMGKLKGWLRSAFSILRIAGIGAGGLAVLFGLIADLSGGSTFWSLTPADWFKVGLALIAVFGAVSILRHEYILHSFGELWGNEHARKLMQDGIPPYRQVYFQYVREGDYATVNRFWMAGFANISDSYGKTDLHIASERGHAAIVDGIIRHGGDPKRPDGEGLTPLMAAAIEGHAKVADVLLAHDCALNAKSAPHGCSALFIAAAHGRLNMVDLLLREGAEIDALDHGNKTPLMAAIAQRKWDVVDRLLDAGANVTRADGDGACVMDYAAAFQAPEKITRRIQESGGQLSNPPFKSTGGGFSRVGHVRVTWKREPALAEA